MIDSNHATNRDASAKKSVAILGTRGYPSYYGGFETAVRHLAPHLCDQNWDVTVYSRPGATKPSDPRADHRVKTIFTRGFERRSLSTLSFGLTSILHAAWKKPDVALIMNVANCVWLPILKARRIPTLVNVDGIEWEREKWSRLAKAVFRIGARASAKWADELVFDARAIGDRWLQEFRRTGVFIPYGGDAEETRPSPMNLEKGSYVLLVARFVPENSVSTFFDAVTRIPRDVPIVLVGSAGYGGPLDDEAAALAEQYTNVTWLGHVSDDDLLHALWQNAGAYFHGHTVGGTNPALVQAMALGAPVVAVDTIFNREVLGDTALFTEATSDRIADALMEMLRDDGLRDRLSAGAAMRAKEQYTWEIVNNAYHRTLMRLVPTAAKNA